MQYTRQQLVGFGCAIPADWPDPIGVLAAPEDVFDPFALRSFVGKPVTLGHPSDGYGVRRENFSSVAVGCVQEAARDGDFVEVVLALTRADAMAAIVSGKVCELSAGYSSNGFDSTQYFHDEGIAPDGSPYRLRKVPGAVDHVALLPKGTARGGADCRILSILRKRSN